MIANTPVEYLHSKYEMIEALAAGKSVLDIGCVQYNLRDARSSSNPWLHGFLKQHASRLVGIDITKEEIEKLRAEGFEAYYADVQTMDLAETFDLIVAGDLIEHTENPGLALRNMRNHLKPGGKLVITTPNPFYIYYQLTIMLLGRLDVSRDHMIWLCPVTIKMQAEKAGLVLERICTFNYSRFFFRALRLPSMLRRLWAGSFLFVLSRPQ